MSWPESAYATFKITDHLKVDNFKLTISNSPVINCESDLGKINYYVIHNNILPPSNINKSPNQNSSNIHNHLNTLRSGVLWFGVYVRLLKSHIEKLRRP